MPGPEFFQTVMGRHFYEGTMPALVRAIEALNKNLGTMLDVEIAAEVNRREVLESVIDKATRRSGFALKLIDELRGKGVIANVNTNEVMRISSIITGLMADEKLA
jgi:hypothetical protein